jgi:hypothetical protein
VIPAGAVVENKVRSRAVLFVVEGRAVDVCVGHGAELSAPGAAVPVGSTPRA